MQRSVRVVTVLMTAAVVSVSTACSSSKSSSGSPAKTPSTSSAASSPAPSTSASSVTSTPSTATLTAITVQPGDLPAGWTSKPAQPDPNEDAYQAALVTCVGGRDTTPDRVAQVHSPDYSQGQATISSSAKALKSPSDVTADTQLLTSPKINDCYAALIRSELAKSAAGATINSLTVTVTPGSGGGPTNVVGTAAAQISLTAQGQTATAFVDATFITGPSIEAEVDFQNVGAPIPAAVRIPVVANVAARAAQG